MLAAVIASIAQGTTACDREPEGDSPVSVVKEFIERMHRTHGEQPNARAAYDMLWSEARKNLADRAERASALAGRKIAPEETIAPSRFTLDFKPQMFESKESGDWAEVAVIGEDPSSQRRTIRLVRENGHWKVVIALPPLPAIRTRPDAGTN